MRALEKCYFSHDREFLNASGLPDALKGAWTRHWSGDLDGALKQYTQLDLNGLPPKLRALAEADKILIEVKRGKPFPDRPSTFQGQTPASKVVLQFARFNSAFWVSHAIARRALVRMVWLSLFVPCRGLMAGSIFLLAHLGVLSEWKRTGQLITHLAYHRVVANRSGSPHAAPFIRDLVLAAYPYTQFLLGRLDEPLDVAIYHAEKHLGNDPYFLYIFNASALYAFAYRGDVARAELYSHKLSEQRKESQTKLYGNTPALLAILPLALRGYGHLIRGRFQELLDNHPHEKTDLWFNSQFYRAASVIALFLGRNALCIECSEKARDLRLLTKSFSAWAPFDERVLELARRVVPFNPAKDSLLYVRCDFAIPPHLGDLIVEMLGDLSEAVHKGADWFGERILERLMTHLEWRKVRVEPHPPVGTDAAPCISIGSNYVTFIGLPEERARYIREIFSGFSPVVNSLLVSLREQAKVEQLETSAATGRLAAQIAHDIRSPLSALQMIALGADGLDENKRQLLRAVIDRIRDMANGLLRQSAERETADTREAIALSDELLASAIEGVVVEKRVQYANRPGLSIVFEPLADSYGTFAKVDRMTFKRVLSNLINNSVESFPGAGTVTVRLSRKAESVIVEIVDTGRGIAENVLPRLMQRGATYGKTAGTGLGLYHAKQAVTSWAGQISITSKLGAGTTVTLLLPVGAAPPWFVPGIALSEGMSIAILDDDPSTHLLWMQRFQATGMADLKFQVSNFTRFEELKEWKRHLSRSSPKTLYLIDYELLADGLTGLEAISELGIAEDSILVTSHSEAESVRRVCATRGIKLLPKDMALHIPFSTPQAR